MNLSILVPVCNERDVVIQTLEKTLAVPMPGFVQSREVVVVDDFSQDGSLEIIEPFVALHPEVKLVRHYKNKGKGAAIRSGMARASGDVYYVQDADLELDPNDLPKLLEAMHEKKVQFVNGSRYLAGLERADSSWWRNIANAMFSSLTSKLIGVKLTDMASGSKLFQKALVSQIQLTEDRFGFEAELIIKSLRIKKHNVVEVPVHYYPRKRSEGKKLKWHDGFKIMGTILKFGLLRIN